MLGDPSGFVLATDHEARHVLQEHQGNTAAVAELDEVCGLEGRFGEEHAVVGDDPDRVPVQMSETSHERGAVLGLELVELTAVDQSRDHLVHVVGLAWIGGHDRAQVGRGVERLDRFANLPRSRGPWSERVDDVAHDVERVDVVVRQVIGHTGDSRVQVSPAELFSGDVLARRRLHQRWAAEEDRALVAHDHSLVAHGGDVRSTGSAGAENCCDLRDSARRHRRLVEEDAAEVIAIGEHLVLHREEGSS